MTASMSTAGAMLMVGIWMLAMFNGAPFGIVVFFALMAIALLFGGPKNEK